MTEELNTIIYSKLEWEDRTDSKKQANGISMSQLNYFNRLDAKKNHQFSSKFSQWSTKKLFQRICRSLKMRQCYIYSKLGKKTFPKKFQYPQESAPFELQQHLKATQKLWIWLLLKCALQFLIWYLTEAIIARRAPKYWLSINFEC